MPKHQTRPTYQSYFTNERRYKNKVKKAQKRYGKCKQGILEKIIEKIVKHRKGYNKAGG